MALVNAKCTNCGGVLQVDKSKDAMVCPYCGAAFIVEKAVQNFNVTNNITAEVVNIYGGKQDFEIVGGILKKYNGSSTNVEVPEGVLEIGADAFNKCKYLTSVTLPSSLKAIGNGAFFECKSLKSVVIPEGVTTIGDCAFARCSSLKNIVLPSTLKETGAAAFLDCAALTEVEIKGTTVGPLAFYGCKSLTKVSLPRSLKLICNYVFYKCGPIDLYYDGDTRALIKLYADCNKYLNIHTNNALDDKSIVNYLEKLFKKYRVCPEEFIDPEEGGFNTAYFTDGLTIPTIRSIFTNGQLLQGTLTLDEESLGKAIISSIGIFDGYTKIDTIVYPKGFHFVNCPICCGLNGLSMFGKCKKCGIKFIKQK